MNFFTSSQWTMHLRRSWFFLPVGNLNLKEANRVSVDKGYVGSNVPIDSGTAVGVQLPIQTVCGTAQTHIGSSRGMHWI
jgi:hypothetical protein